MPKYVSYSCRYGLYFAIDTTPHYQMATVYGQFLKTFKFSRETRRVYYNNIPEVIALLAVVRIA